MFKKFLAYLLIISLLLPALPVQAEGIYKMVGSGAVTLANMRISAVNGTAFIDFSDSEAAANKLINHKGYLLKVRDSSKRAIQGYVKAQGTGETYAAPLYQDDCAADGTASWVATDSLTFDTDHYVLARNGTLMRARNSSAFTRLASGKLGVLLMSVKDGTLTSQSLYLKTCNYSSAATIMAKTITTTGSFVENRLYSTANNLEGFVGIQKDESVNGNIQFKLISYKEVLTPSATGVTIASTKGGSTFNFAALDSAFNYNDASGYTYELWQVNNAVEVASGSIAAGQMLADTTATNAFVAPVGVDLSAYQTGKYIFAAYNTVGGYAAFGYIMGTAPGVETLGDDLITNGDMSSSTGWTVVGGSAVIGGGVLTMTGAGASISQTANPLIPNALIYTSFDINSTTSTVFNLYDLGSGVYYYRAAPTTGNKTGYKTAKTGVIAFLNEGTGNIEVDNLLAKRVTDCAATGALIVSAKDGATRALAYKHASFNPNIASTFKRFYVGD